jgi:hypothetical protein
LRSSVRSGPVSTVEQAVTSSAFGHPRDQGLDPL